MIKVTKMNQSTAYVNAERIETIEAHPDCVLTLRGGTRLVVAESPEEIVRRIIQYKRSIQGGINTTPPDGAE